MVVDFGLVVTLRIVERGESMRDFVLITETLHLLAGEVCFIVRDNGIGELELVYYVLPKKLDNLLPGDFKEWHYLDPFGEVGGGYQEKL